MKTLTVGSARMDSIAVISSDRLERMSMKNSDAAYMLVQEGREIEAVEASTHCGGEAINAAVAMARLGCDVETIVKLGKDARAEVILSRLLAEGVSARWVVRDDRAPTGTSMLISSHDRNAATFTFHGANGLLEAGDLRDDAFDVNLIYISSLRKDSVACFSHLIARAVTCGALVAANPGDALLSRLSSEIERSLTKVDILAMNRPTAERLGSYLLAGRGQDLPTKTMKINESPRHLPSRGLVVDDYTIAFAKKILPMVVELGPRYVLLNDDSSGAYVGTRDEILFCPAIKNKVLGTAGSDDALAATFATEIACDRPSAEALAAGALNAAAVRGFVDAQTGLLLRDALDAQLESCKESLSVVRWKI